MKEPKEPDIGYTVTNKKNFFFLFPVQLAIPPQHQVFQLL